MNRRHLRYAPICALGHLLVGTAAVFGPQCSFAAAPPDPAAACAKLATLTAFPVAPTQITLAKFIPAGTASADNVALPDHWQVQGIINQRIGVDGFPYGRHIDVGAELREVRQAPHIPGKAPSQGRMKKTL